MELRDPFGSMNTVKDLLNDPHILGRNILEKVNNPLLAEMIAVRSTQFFMSLDKHLSNLLNFTENILWRYSGSWDTRVTKSKSWRVTVLLKGLTLPRVLRKVTTITS
ncbi:MAG: hypothetical protein QW756_00325 [Nitrososphaerota archaeon]